MSAQPIWLASYPRSGNTLLRTVLHHCFGLASASIYSNDLGGNKDLESYVGHIEHDANGKIKFPAGSIPLIKTHEPPRNEQGAIYVVRDGRAACVSLWEFYGRKLPLEKVISGQHRFGTWANHLSAWRPRSRPNTLLIKFENITNNLDIVVEEISRFLDVKIICMTIPERESVAKVDGRWVRKKSDWREFMTGKDLELFCQANGQMMGAMGYELNRIP